MMTGVTNDDFAQILSEMGRILSYQVVTITNEPMTGEQTSTYATASNKTIVFFLEESRWLWDKAGLVEVGDAYVMATTATGIKRYDKFSVDGNTYIIDKVFRRHVMGVSMCDYGLCFKVD